MLVTVTTHAFPASCFINSLCDHDLFERSIKGGDTLCSNFSEGQGSLLEQVIRVITNKLSMLSQTQEKHSINR